MSRDMGSSSSSTHCNRRDYLRVGNRVLERIRERLEEGSVRSHLGVQGLLALIDDKIRRFNDEGSYNELLELAVDAVVVFTQFAKDDGYLPPGEEDVAPKKTKEMTATQVKPQQKSEPKPRRVRHVKTNLPKVDGPPSDENVTLTPCPRCSMTPVQAGPQTNQLPDPVCIECEEDLPGGSMAVEEYLGWIRRGPNDDGDGDEQAETADVDTGEAGE